MFGDQVISINLQQNGLLYSDIYRKALQISRLFDQDVQSPLLGGEHVDFSI